MQITDFPILLSTLEGRRIANVTDAVQKLSEAVEAGEISNKVYKDTVKYYLNEAFDHAWEVKVQRPFFWGDRDYDLNDGEKEIYRSLSFHPMAHTVDSFIKKIEKPGVDTEFTRTALALLAEIKVLGDAIVSLKDKVVKRQPKAPEDLKAKYNAPAASARAIGQVRDILIEITDKAFQDLLTYLQDAYATDVETYVSRTNAVWAQKPAKDGSFTREERKLWGDKQAFANSALPSIMFMDATETLAEEWNSHLGVSFRKAAVAANAKVITDAEALKDAERTRDNFIYKNLAKLDSILEAKGDFEKIEIIGYQLSLGSLEGTLRLTFKDGAAFTIVNKVVNVTNSYGTNFDRHPLTFHDVVMGGGSNMGRPSEERMNTVFVGKAA